MGENRRKSDQFLLRLPDGLRESIRAAAASNGRSMNAEIVARLEAPARPLRDHFAGQAVLAAAQIFGGEFLTKKAQQEDRPVTAVVAGLAYALADALLEERAS